MPSATARAAASLRRYVRSTVAPAPANASAIAGADAAARARDDGAHAVEPAVARLRRAVRRPRYPSAPAANGCRASAAPSSTSCTLGSLPSARAIDSFVAW